MRKWVILAAVVLVYYYSRQITDTAESFMITDETALTSQNVQAFLRGLRAGESSQGPGAYNMLVYGGTFSDMSTHPKIFKPIPGSTLFTSAAGAYQITYSTWVWLHVLAGVDDFTPESQDKMAVAYLRKLGALKDIIEGRYAVAIEKCAPVWESITIPFLKTRIDLAYLNYGGTIA